MKSPKEERKQIYEVWIVKYNDEPLIAISVDSYDKCYEKWKELTDTWVTALKDKIPFILTNPIVTAFDPGTVKEITLRPVIQMAESKYENPYQQEMLKKGLTNTLRREGNIINKDILDEGYS